MIGKPVLSIVIVNSDGRVDTLNCLRSLDDNQPFLPFEVILVDNGSKDLIEPVLPSEFNWIRLVRLESRM
jgi:GT2 family glycosyltransferase